jgi:hypothetical protein
MLKEQAAVIISNTHVEAENVNKKEENMKQSKRFSLAIMAACLLCFCLLFGTAASAADENPCSEDIARFCQNIKPGTPALMECLEKNEGELSTACKAYEANMGGPRAERREQARDIAKFRQACANDMVKFCKEASSGQGGILKCLNDHEKDLSSSCSESMKPLKEEK